jgi:phage replication-related protein YjqB (UPF0714/DUF867 family)
MLKNHHTLHSWQRYDYVYTRTKIFAHPTPNEKYSFRYFGDSPILFVAPHGVRHIRATGSGGAEIGTAGLAEAMAERCKGMSLATLSRTTFAPRELSPISDILLSLDLPNLLVIDLHGMSNRYQTDLCVGTSIERSPLVKQLAEQIQFDCAKLNLHSSINYPYAALTDPTIAHFVQSRGGHALQIELALRLRDFSGDARLRLSVIEVLQRLFKHYLQLRSKI